MTASDDVMPTMQLESQLFKAGLDLLALPLSHEAIVNVYCNHPVWPQGGEQESCTHCTVNTATHQALGEGGGTRMIGENRGGEGGREGEV